MCVKICLTKKSKVMKNVKIFVVSISLLGALLICCQNEVMTENCTGENTKILNTFYSDEFAVVPCSLQNIDSEVREVNLVIKNQKDFENYITCSAQLPEIDFEKYFILAGMYKHNQCAVFDSQQVLLCNNRIVYRVGMLEQVCAAFTNVYYFAVIDRQHVNLPVVFDVKFSN